jgi:hypothetical protein
LRVFDLTTCFSRFHDRFLPYTLELPRVVSLVLESSSSSLLHLIRRPSGSRCVVSISFVDSTNTDQINHQTTSDRHNNTKENETITMLASLGNPLLLFVILSTSQHPASARAHALPEPQGIANQQPLQQQQQQQPQRQQPQEAPIPDRITMHTTLTLYTATETITVPNTREAMQTSLSSFAEDAGEAYEADEVDECDPAQCAGCRAWYLCRADLGVEW